MMQLKAWNTSANMTPRTVLNALTIDVEDYFQVSAFSPFIPRSSWDSLPCRIEANVERILSLLDVHGVRATFFTLGWIAQRYPAMVRRIADCGHEIASHGYSHARATEQTLNEFSEDVKTSKCMLEEVTGKPVHGYRAPSFSVDTRKRGSRQALIDAGYRYSSSIYPIRHDHYGSPSAPRFAFRPMGSAAILELPITTVSAFGRTLPAGGGGYFRLFPYAFSRWMLKQVNDGERQPAIFYFHPWELDPGQPRQRNLSAKTRFRHYLNLHRMEKRIAYLVRDFHWDRIDNIFLQKS